MLQFDILNGEAILASAILQTLRNPHRHSIDKSLFFFFFKKVGNTCYLYEPEPLFQINNNNITYL